VTGPGSWCTRIAASILLVMLASAVWGCGSGADGIAARVGDVPIAANTVSHWMRVLNGGGKQTEPAKTGGANLRVEALELLIARQWLIGEAERRGISPSPAEVRAKLGVLERIEFPGGKPEQEESLKASGETLADLKQEVRAELAARKIRQSVLAAVPPVKQAEVAAYYEAHRRSFRIPEGRKARFRNWKHFSEAAQVKREVEHGKSLTSPQQKKVHELFVVARVPPVNPYEAAIDKSKPGVVSGPYYIHNDYWLYFVVKVIPARQRTLGEVAGSIRRKLTSGRRHVALADLKARWAAHWTALTDCSSGYVVQRCRQYGGPRTEEDPLSVQ
jgi:hypothetical protein